MRLARRPTVCATLGAALLTTLAAGAASAALLAESSGSFSCSYKDFSRCTEGSASVTLQGGRVQSVVFKASFCANKRQQAGSCSVEAARGGPLPWADEGRRATVPLTDPRQPGLDDALDLLVEDTTVVLDFTDTQPANRCQGGGDLPDKIVIDPASRQCRVVF